MEKDYINIISYYYDLSYELNEGVLKDMECREYIFSQGTGGAWDGVLGKIINNEITVSIAKAVTSEIIVLVLKELYNRLKNHKEAKKDYIKDNDRMVVIEGDLVIHVYYGGFYQGALGPNNIDELDEETVRKFKEDGNGE